MEILKEEPDSSLLMTSQLPPMCWPQIMMIMQCRFLSQLHLTLNLLYLLQFLLDLSLNLDALTL